MANGNLRQRLRHKPDLLRCPSTRPFNQPRLCSEPHKTLEFLPLSLGDAPPSGLAASGMEPEMPPSTKTSSISQPFIIAYPMI